VGDFLFRLLVGVLLLAHQHEGRAAGDREDQHRDDDDDEFFLPPLAGASPSAASALAGAFDMLDHSLSHCIVIHHARPTSLE
jgi:hypothetical protein